jgi:DNA-binding transcriptional ArsR family regulator
VPSRHDRILDRTGSGRYVPHQPFSELVNLPISESEWRAGGLAHSLADHPSSRAASSRATAREDGPTIAAADQEKPDDDRLDETFAALANSTRRAILARLARGDASVNELAEPFELTLPAISKHLKVLERAGLVTRSQRVQYRPCALDAAPLRAVATWADQYRPIWELRVDRRSDHLDQLQQANARPSISERSTRHRRDDEEDRGEDSA